MYYYLTSVYILEKWLYPKSWKNQILSDTDLQDEFLGIIQYFEDIWWNHYELSSWARPWYESLHNQAYWDHSETRGFWLSAASYIAPRRFTNSDSFSGYYKGEIIEAEVLTPEQLDIENLMFWLRTARGYDITDGLIILNTVKIDEFVSRGLIMCEKNNIKLTKTWIFLIDHIISELISLRYGVNKVTMSTRSMLIRVRRRFYSSTI
jgi:oxygen-independent coproporphyrinogen-3 oxidase